MNIYIDIETIPQQPEESVKAEIAKTIQAPAQMSKPETIEEWHGGAGKYAGVKDALIEETYRKTSLDGTKGEIISIAFANDECVPIVTFRGLEAGIDSERNLLKVTFEKMHSLLGGRNPWFIGHNIGGFDLKYLFQRCVINKFNPMIDLKQYGKHASQFYDTSTAWAGYGNRISQDNLCKALSLEGKPADITGANVWDHYKAGNIIRIAEYNANDIETVRKIHKRLTFSS